MTTTTKSLLAVCTVAFGATSLHADDSPFSISAFIVGIEGEGFVGNNDTQVGVSWDFPSEQEGSLYVYDVADTPLSFEETVTSPLGGISYGRAECVAEVTETQVIVEASTLCFNDRTEGGEYVYSYAQVHGEFHIQIDSPCTIEYDLCNETNGLANTWGQLYLRKFVNGNFQTMVEHVTNYGAGLDCEENTIDVEAGYYQLYFVSYIHMNPSTTGNPEWALNSSDTTATLTILKINVADINGDGIVDGADLARVLGAWGTSAPGADLNGDGTVDGADLALVLAAWT